jgi:aspartate dehydrogenase
MLKVGLVGCGAIGTRIIEDVLLRYKEDLRVYIYDIQEGRLKDLRDKFSWLYPLSSLEELVSKSQFIIEAASVKCAKELLPLSVKYKRDILIMSTGALFWRKKCLDEARKIGIKIIIPSGAIAGLDAINALRGKIERIELNSYKPATSLKDAPYIKKERLNLDKLKGTRLIFKGSVKEAVKGFPQNINVAATLLFSSGLKDIDVKIYACPKSKYNLHKIKVYSKASALEITCKNYPSPSNPKTSSLAILSACKAVEEYIEGKIKRR